MAAQTLQENSSSLKKAKFYFDKVTSNNGTDWLLALVWVVFFELISSIIEFEYLDVAQTYVYHIPHNFITELIVAFMVVAFAWFCVMGIIFMKRSTYFLIAFYAIFGLYMIITSDVTFNLLVHNLVNPFELDNFNLYFVSQILIKVITTYLIYMTYVSLKNSKKI